MMTGITTGLFIRFFLGGAAVVVSTIISRKLGAKAGGIFAAFPAVYLAALLTNRLSFTGNELISHSISLSKGAIFGMAINILVAILAGYLLKKGWKRGLVNSIICWFALSFAVVLITSN
jgi:putative Ca2+/H+ antiporter (TMEM165/GDT1 family)